MKKVIIFLCVVLMSLSSFSQTSVNADGTIKNRGNVAIMVTSHTFSFKDGVFKKTLDDATITELKSAFNAIAIQKFDNLGFGIVNRDNEAYENVKTLLEEQKLEDYINGFSVTAKGEGADVLFLSDITMYNEKNVAQIFLSCRIINITNNKGYHYSMKTDPITDNLKMASQIKKMVNQYNDFLTYHILDVYPEQYGIAKSAGKKLYLIGYQPNGRILKNDKFYAFKFGKETLRLSGQKKIDVQVLQKVATASNPEPSGGYCLVKSDKALQPSKDLVLFRNQTEVDVSADKMLLTFFALNYDPNTYEGFIKNRVNNAVYDALTRHPGAVIIEQEHLPELKKERELQKTEDFIDGHVVEQMKAIGAQYMAHLDNFMINGSQVSFQLNMVSIEQNKIIRSVDVITSIDNIENEMYKQFCERFAHPCNISMIDKKNATLLNGWTLPVNSKLIVYATKEIQNQMTGETTYTKVQVCKCTVTEYMGCKSMVRIDEIISEEDYKLLSKYSDAGMLTIMIDGSDIATSTSSESDIDKAIKKQERAERRRAFLEALEKAAMEGAH